MSKITGEWIDNIYTVDSASGDGSTTVFNLLDDLQSVSSLDVFIDGLRRKATTDYTVNLGASQVTFVVAPANAQSISFKYIRKSI